MNDKGWGKFLHKVGRNHQDGIFRFSVFRQWADARKTEKGVLP